jgi:hypothetical protein
MSQAPIIHDYTGEKGSTLGRLKRYGNDPHKTRLTIEHFDPAVKVGHWMWIGESMITGTKYKVIASVKGPAKRGIKTPQFWAHLAREREPIYLGGNVY